MSIKRIRRLSVLLVILLLTGCGLSDTPVPPGNSQISTKPEASHYMTGLRVNYGELKESGAVFTDEAVEFQDPVIEEMLRTILGKPDGAVLRSDLQSIHAIYWRSGNRYWSNLQSDDGKLPKDGSEWYSTGQPQTLADLSYCDNLQWLEIGAIELPSLEPLYSLTQLAHVSFNSTIVSAERWEELVRLPALTGLELDFRDMTADHTGATTKDDTNGNGALLLPLAAQLKVLCIEHPLTWETETLSQFTELEYLRVTYAKTLSFLAAMPKLRDLSLSNCQAEDWSALEQLPELSYLQLIKCGGFTMEDLSKVRALTDLSMTMCSISENRDEILSALPNLEALSFK